MRPTGSSFDHVLEIQRPVVRASRSLTETVEANDIERQALVDFTILQMERGGQIARVG